jgi:hypothetical protein
MPVAVVSKDPAWGADPGRRWQGRHGPYGQRVGPRCCYARARGECLVLRMPRPCQGGEGSAPILPLASPGQLSRTRCPARVDATRARLPGLQAGGSGYRTPGAGAGDAPDAWAVRRDGRLAGRPCGRWPGSLASGRDAGGLAIVTKCGSTGSVSVARCKSDVLATFLVFLVEVHQIHCSSYKQATSHQKLLCIY